eukprot:91700_1
MDMMPSLLKVALLNNNNKYPVSFIELTVLFPNCNQIILTDINAKTFTNKCENYIMCVIKYIEYINMNKTMMHNVNEITIESNQEIESKPNPTLKKFSETYSSLFVEASWTIKYQFKLETHHSLSFTKSKHQTFKIGTMTMINEAITRYEEFKNQDNEKKRINNKERELSTTRERASKFMQLIDNDQT